MNLEKISILQAVRLLAALVPGIIIVVAIAITFPEGFQQFMHFPDLGYYTKLSVLVGIAYLSGFLLDEVVTVSVGMIFGVLVAWVLKSEKRRAVFNTLSLAVAPWRDQNWQRLASVYLGADLAPQQSELKPGSGTAQTAAPNIPPAVARGGIAGTGVAPTRTAGAVPNVGPALDAQWRFWYLTIKSSFPKLEEAHSRRAILADVTQTCSCALFAARIIVSGHHHLALFVVIAVACFFISGFHKLMLIGMSLGYLASDLTGADLGAAMLDKIRVERTKEENV